MTQYITVGTLCTAILFALGLVARYIVPLLHGALANGILGRAVQEVTAAVHEVDSTYVDAIKLANADGVLTEAEKKEAKAKAIAVAKSNLGVKGLATLARIVGADSVAGWLGSWVERALSAKRTSDAHADAATMAAGASPLAQAPLPSSQR